MKNTFLKVFFQVLNEICIAIQCIIDNAVCFAALQRRNMYHVQFFGEEEERAWISESRLEPYVSKSAHLKWLAEQRKKHKSDKRTYAEAPAGRRRGAWDIACLESEDAINMDRSTRRQQYTLVYTEDKPSAKSGSRSSGDRKSTSSASKKRKLSTSSDATATTDTAKADDVTDDKSPPKKRRRRRSSFTEIENDSLLLPDPTHVQFLVYSAKKRDMFRREHPGYTEAKLTQMLKQKWDKLSADEKSKYIPMGSDVKDVCSPGG